MRGTNADVVPSVTSDEGVGRPRAPEALPPLMAPPRDQSGSRRWSVPRVGVGAGATTPPALAPIAAAGIRMRLVLPAVAAALAALAGAANAPTSTRTRAMVHDDDPRSCVAMGKAFQEEGECQAPSTFCNAKKLDLTPLQRESTAESEKPTLVVAWCSESIDWVVDYGCSAANFVIYSKCNATFANRPGKKGRQGQPYISDAMRSMPCVTIHDQNSNRGAKPYARGHHASYLTYMIDYYGRYPKKVFFLKATLRGFRNPSRWIRWSKKNIAVENMSFVSFGSKIIGTYTPGTLWKKSALNAFVCGGAPKMFHGIARACFGTTSDRLMRWPRCYYTRLLKMYFTYWSQSVGKGRDIGWAIERYYNIMFRCIPPGGSCGPSGDKCHGSVRCVGDSTIPLKEALKFTAKKKAPSGKTSSSGKWGYIDKSTIFGRWKSTMRSLWKSSEWTDA